MSQTAKITYTVCGEKEEHVFNCPEFQAETLVDWNEREGREERRRQKGWVVLTALDGKRLMDALGHFPVDMTVQSLYVKNPSKRSTPKKDVGVKQYAFGGIHTGSVTWHFGRQGFLEAHLEFYAATAMVSELSWEQRHKSPEGEIW